MTKEIGLVTTHDLVVKWAQERDLIYGSNPLDQFGKLLEEVNELYTALRASTSLQVEGSSKSGINAWELTVADESVRDAIGDIMVVLTIIAAQCETSLAACYEHAYQQIKDRKGKMVNGVFVKEENKDD